MKLDITLKRQNRVLTVYLKGELDHHAVSKVKETIDLQLVKMPVSQLILDMSAVTFMDSSGVGLIVGRFNKMKSLGGSMKIKNPGFSILKVLQMSGLSRLMEIS
ncbi:MAG TPA: anti-anti-sigma factor [Ruminiclostridium sp.]|nr:anti-sigma factor antagonist [Clostridiaceae bacterium]HAA24520.1 anti-anti-sigma factor [Ruminiclostridium sp.]